MASVFLLCIMIERAADQTRTDDPLVNSQLNSNAEPHLNLLYHAELQRRTIQQIQAQNKCYGKLNSYGYFRTRIMNVIKVGIKLSSFFF